MASTTSTRATHRLSLRSGAARGSLRSERILTARAPADAFSSPAGLRRQPWLRRLRRGLAEDLFVLHYQPIVSLSDGRVSMFEALLRLADEPAGRLLSPGAFLPAAERFGMIGEIDRMVLAKVIALLGARGERALGGDRGADVTIAVNLSALSLTDGRTLALIEGLLERHAVDPAGLVLEVTETAAIS